MKKMLLLTKHGLESASSRQRFFKYVDNWEKAGYSTRLNQLVDEDYLVSYNAGIQYSRFKLLKSYIRRLIFLLRYGFQCDIMFIHRGELFPMFPTTLLLDIFKLSGVKIITDYDDAVFYSYDTSTWIGRLNQRKLNSIIKLANCIITGSPYLTSYCKQFNNKVVEIPTSIDLTEYPLYLNTQVNTIFTIGWIGSKSTSAHLNTILQPLLKFAEDYQVNIKLIGYDKGLSLEHRFVQQIEWEEGKDYEQLKDVEVGIMPLINAEYERGKCGFKLIQYMASAKPFIATPLEANVKLDKNKENLFAISDNEWYEALEKIYKERTKYQEIGKRNRCIVEQYYAIQSNAKLYTKIFNQIL